VSALDAKVQVLPVRLVVNVWVALPVHAVEV
jgi:hypothetical protein